MSAPPWRRRSGTTASTTTAAATATACGSCAATARACWPRAWAGRLRRPSGWPSLRFELAPDAPAALEALSRAGARVGVVSNWDCSLPDVLRDLGVAGAVDAVVTSAVAGASKPDPAIFRAALDELGVAPGEAIHCGDDPAKDCAGARAAGIRAVLLDRSGTLAAAGCPRITSLGELPGLTGLEGALR